jgi:two-component system response regulator FlrC
VAVNCAALSETLLMSELFGHERGSFTDARQQKKGVFELAHGGTLLLDEVSEMGVRAQAALLRALEQRCFTRVGGQSEIKIDVRVIAASNRDMQQLVSTGQFRIDLYHRLNVVRVVLPSLRERAGDIPSIAEHLSRTIALNYGEAVRPVTPAAVAALENYDWPGNIRELENGIQRALLLSDDDLIEPHHVEIEPRSGTRIALNTTDSPLSSPKADGVQSDISSLEREHILRVLSQVKGNRKEAISILGISERALRYKLKAYKEAGFEFD